MASKTLALTLAGSVLSFAFADVAMAQTTPSDSTVAENGDDIIVTGTRVQGRTRLDSTAPVDVLNASTLQQQGTTELGAALTTVAPSLTFPRPSATDGTDAIRPATLRGLSPDQTLVLINGVRANASALVNTNGTVGRGSAAVDLNTIPTVALESVEVLRDGASAQYGSDAIAGVVNLRLKEARSGGGVSVNYGIHATEIDTARGSRSVTGEHVLTVSGWQGIALGAEGFLTLSGEYIDRSATSRGDFDPRVTPNRVTSRFGDPEVDSYTFYANAGIPVGDDWQLYGWAGYQQRESESAAFPRIANAQTALAGYADGFLPFINTKSKNLNTALGLRGELSGWNVDVNVGYGRNRIAFRTLNSANYAYGAATPHDFYDGALTYDQLVGGIDVAQKFDVFQSLNVAFGVEARREGFQISAGEPASYGYPTGTSFGSPGAQGFGGFSPLNEINRHRNNIGAYLDLEAELVPTFTLGLAGRYEHYSDFGSTWNGKVSARWDIVPQFAIRGTASTGFRAPSLQQQYFTNVASVIPANGQDPISTGTYPSVSPVAVALGGLPLEPEKSTNFSAGFVFRSGGFNLTVDAYHIRIRDQIGLSELIQRSFSPQVNTLLTPYDVDAARFFLNGIRTRARGVDVVGNYRLNTSTAGRFDLTLAANFNDIDVTRVPTNTAAGLSPAPTLVSRQRIMTIERGTPRTKLTGSIDWQSEGGVGATLRGTYYGNVIQPSNVANGSTDIHTGRHLITDLEVRFKPTENFTFALGGSNIFDVYPDAYPASLNTSGVTAFPYYSPFGFNGRFLYARVGVNW